MVFKDNFVVSVKVEGKILREIDGVVHIPFGTEYSILMKNLSEKRAVVKVEIDGESVLGSRSLVINPNSTSDLERYLRYNNSKGNRFKFIEKTEDISDYRGDRIDDGIIRVTYQFEKEYFECVYRSGMIRCPNTPSSYCEFINTPCHKCMYRRPRIYWYDTWTYEETVYDGKVCSGYGTAGSPSYSSSSNSTSINNYCDSSSETLCFNGSNSEEGITVPGSISHQEFTDVSVGNLESKKHVITLKLVGSVGQDKISEPITVKTKLTCITCGKSNKSDMKYCGNCGTSLKLV